MTGLLIKDLKIMKSQFRFMIVAVFAGFAMMVGYGSVHFVATYLTVMGLMMVLNTISYDEFDNGFAFLFTLPVTRKMYVAEKYVLELLFSFLCCLVSCLLQILLQMKDFQGRFLTAALQPDLWIFGLGSWMGILLATSVMLPLYLKYSGEKGRVILLGIAGLLIAMGFVLAKAGKASSGFRGAVESIGGGIAAWCTSNPEAAGILALAAVAAVFFLSLGISIHVMEGKEF